MISICSMSAFWYHAQTVCDSLQILQVNVDAFYPNRIDLKVFNSSSEIFSYPGFRIYDENENLIGEEEVWFFGIAGESNHVVEFNPAEHPFETLTTYSFTIELWTNFYQEMICSYEIDAMIMPQPIDCVDIQMSFSEFSTEQASYEILLSDFQGNEIHSEVLFFQPNVGVIERFFCLFPTCYWLTASTDLDPEFSHLNLSMEANDSYGFLFSALLDQEQENSIQFGIWNDCSSLGYGDLTPGSPLSLYPNPSQNVLYIEGSMDTNFDIFNSIGQLITSDSYSSFQTKFIDISHFTPGIYFLRSTDLEKAYTISFIKE